MAGVAGGAGLFGRVGAALQRLRGTQPLLDTPRGAEPATLESWTAGMLSELPNLGGMVTIEGEAEPRRRHETQLLSARRATLRAVDERLVGENAPPTGLALSGGGIRSATFSLGLLRELGRAGLLHRSDYLSTVSGGSYIGSYYASLFAKRGAEGAVIEPAGFAMRAQEENGKERPADPFDAPLGKASLAWLRNSGRYLAPSGAGDYWYAIGLLVRNWLGIHVVIGSTLILLALLGAGFRFGMLEWVWPCLHVARSRVLDRAPMVTLLAIPVMLHIWFGWAYWLTRRGIRSKGVEKGEFSIGQIGSLLITAFAIAYWFLRPDPDGIDRTFQVVSSSQLLLLLIASSAGGNIVLWWAYALSKGLGDAADDRETRWDHCRTLLTRPLMWFAMLFVGIAVVGAADALGFWLYGVTYDHGLRSAIASPAIAAAMVPIGRWLVNKLLSADSAGASKDGAKPGFFSSALLYKLGSAAAAIILMVAVITFWVMLAYKASWPLVQRIEPVAAAVGQPAEIAPGTPIAIAAGQAGAAAAKSGTVPALVKYLPWDGGETPAPARTIGRIVGSWALLLGSFLALSYFIGRTRSFLNLSGLTSFYAGRLRRAYLGAGNRNRIVGNPEAGNKPTALDLWDRQDDVALSDYYAAGRAGPLHLINVTLNETRGKGTAIVQRDRHGRNLVVSPIGIYYQADHQAGQQPAPRVPLEILGYGDGDHEQLPLSSWIAISGAAFSTGLGARTGFPLTQLAGLANVRLGYWWRLNEAAPLWRGSFTASLKYGLTQQWFTQYGMLREFRGDFPGPTEQYCYLSDGGHFENTGAYELVRRRLPFITVSDNGMDERFEYEDVANLVRKARIDFDTEINFLGVAALDRVLGHDPALRAAFGSLAQIAGSAPAAPLAVAALARIDYPDKTYGTLVLIKPRLTGDGPADLIRYKAANLAFPQQTTLDQFFDEAQWESYYHLGRLITQAVFRAPEKDGRWYPSRMVNLFSRDWLRAA